MLDEVKKLMLLDAHDDEAMLLIDGKQVTLPIGAEIVFHEPQEIVEQGITALRLQEPGGEVRTTTPLDGFVKWFRDEFGSLWVKYSIIGEDPTTKITHVCPAWRVIDVQYRKSL